MSFKRFYEVFFNEFNELGEISARVPIEVWGTLFAVNNGLAGLLCIFIINVDEIAKRLNKR